MATKSPRCESPGSSADAARRKARRAELLANMTLRSCAARRRRYAVADLWPPPPFQAWSPHAGVQGWWEAFAEGLRPEGDWLQHFRMRPALFAQLVDALRGRLQAVRIVTREEPTVEKRLAIALFYLSSGKSFRELSEAVGVAPSVVADAVVEVCWAIQSELLCKTVCLGPDVAQAMAGFSRLGIPHCIGVVDMISFYIGASKDSAQPNQSILLQGTVDAEGRFIDLEVKLCPGKISGSSLFLRSTLYVTMEAGAYVPGNPTLTLEGVAVPALVIASRAYPLRRWLMTPYRRCRSHSEIHFNNTLDRVQVITRCAFGQLTCRWKCLTVPSQLQAQEAMWIIAACVVLHNICGENGQGPPLAQRPMPEAAIIAGRGQPVSCSIPDVKVVRDVVARYMFANWLYSSRAANYSFCG